MMNWNWQFMVIFCPLTSLKPKESKFWKTQKITCDVINLLMCTKNHNHMIDNSWGMEWDTELFVISGHLFLNEKNAWIYYPFIYVHHRWQSYDVWSQDMECNRHNFFSFWVISCVLIPLTIQKIKTLKKSKKCQEILSF